jgi:hypothetical protein
MRRFVRDNALTLVLFSAFLLLLTGESVVGWRANNNDRQTHHQSAISWPQFISSGGFLEATTENWESEFLEMAAFVWLTSFLVQKGSPGTRCPGEIQPQDRAPDPARPGAPWPVRRGGWVLKIYSSSLSLGFITLFLLSFLLHAAGGAREFSRQQVEHGQPAVTLWRFLGTSEFWFQSLQNWQSEFLGIGMMVTLSIFLRQKGSPESKPVDAAHHENK